MTQAETPHQRPPLRESDLDADPIEQFRRWFEEAAAGKVEMPEAMMLATASADGKPSARMVLLRDYDERGFVFFTNYDSRKGRELAANPWAALVFFWVDLDRQVRIEGKIEQTSAEDSDRYFASRPYGSRLSAWASEQSEGIANRDVLEQRMAELQAKYPGPHVPRPPHWGGYRVMPTSIEFWQGRPNRLHDRLRYTRSDSGSWVIQRLSP